jgi:hypothetical protein
MLSTLRRTNLRMIGNEDIEYEEIGAATIGAAMAAAKVDEVAHTPYSPTYGDLFTKIVEDNRFSQNPDVVSNPEKEAAEAVEGQLLELGPEPEFDETDEQLNDNSENLERG